MIVSNTLAAVAAAACAAAAAAGTILIMDANPSLYCYHQLLQLRQQQQQRQQAAALLYRRRYEGKTIWLIGASSGIGEELAYQISRYTHCRKLILTSRNTKRLNEVAQKCKEEVKLLSSSFNNHNKKNDDKTATSASASAAAPPPPTEVVVVPMDVTSTATELEDCLLQRIVPQLSSSSSSSYANDEVSQQQQQQQATTSSSSNTEAQFNKLDCVIFNAGIGHTSTVIDTDPETTIQMFRVNCIPPILITQLLLKHNLLTKHKQKKKQKQADNNNNNNNNNKSQLVFISSVAGRLGLPLSASYCASKHAMMGFANSLQSETFSWLDIKIVCPGPIDTPFFINQPQQQQKSQQDGSSITTNNNNNNNNKHKSTTSSSSPFKMSVKRCASLTMTHLCRRGRSVGGGSEAWISKQPTLTGLYLNQYFPTSLLWSFVLNRIIGPKRVSLYNQGLDLYDPSSWRKKKKNDQQQ